MLQYDKLTSDPFDAVHGANVGDRHGGLYYQNFRLNSDRNTLPPHSRPNFVSNKWGNGSISSWALAENHTDLSFKAISICFACAYFNGTMNGTAENCTITLTGVKDASQSNAVITGNLVYNKTDPNGPFTCVRFDQIARSGNFEDLVSLSTDVTSSEYMAFGANATAEYFDDFEYEVSSKCNSTAPNNWAHYDSPDVSSASNLQPSLQLLRNPLLFVALVSSIVFFGLL